MAEDEETELEKKVREELKKAAEAIRLANEAKALAKVREKTRAAERGNGKKRGKEGK